MHIEFRLATFDDLPALLALENQCFALDRLTPRSFRWMLSHANASLLVAQRDGQLMGYALLLFHRGTSLARLYSIAIAEQARGRGLGARLLEQAERCALEHDRAYLRLEVRTDNPKAIALYERHGYRRFAQVDDYYEDHTSALRYEKRILQHPTGETRLVPYYAQTTDFTCGPACLLMAMAALQPLRPPSRREELRLWREATTVFMTSGHGGCSPHGLALAAWRRGFRVRLLLNTEGPLFLDGVRQPGKKEVMRLVHEDFCAELQDSDVVIARQAPDLPRVLAEGGLALVLISNYRLTGSKAPHWVLVTACDDDFVYLHDPDTDHARHRQALDCQHLPVSHQAFQRMSLFGGRKLRAAVVVYAGGETAV
ncbi:peptidase C39 family protein [Pseudomonas mosselii]|uniref:peptidase C39 family protein n=1 Tax=Pseudomonas mosselii TaxID=78327 RepID=UPI000BB46009|nr:peptidase C39 family protein [Pseudomonas mosselii]ATB66082.1 ribosomal-protein-alanine acetyltransferase [Pseudomonas mosselii]MDH1103190.1 peptidase C39 family protein [Pseudomonas mosselii]MEA3237314.1 peptidase C39 family protein [Pseudomonas mosselii]MEB5932559.1 peptidase C39 family protein [Pseudomonas mosselii]UVN43840.1 peptidase C39 family protein [Pseudomonas mosselii]